MPAQSQLSIKFPRRHNCGPLGLHTKFVAFGVASGEIQSINASLSLRDGTFVTNSQPVQIIPPRGRLMKWLAPFVVQDLGFYVLTVQGLNDKGNVINEKHTNVHVSHGVLDFNPQILYPPDNQNIIDERDYFVTYGTRSGTPVTSVSVTPDGEGSITNTSPYDNGLDYWSAVFDLTELEPDLPTITLVANGANATSRNICILS